MDEFKKYIIDNQDHLNADEPSPLVWEKVQQRMKDKQGQHSSSVPAETILKKFHSTAKVLSIRRLVQWSAAACILGLAGIGVWNLFNDKNVAKPLQEQVVTNEEKGITTPNNSFTPSNNHPANIEKVDEATVATESIAPSASSSQPILSKTTQSFKSSRANSTAAINNNDKAMSALTSMETGFTQIINLQKGKISTTPMYAESASYFNEFKAQ